MSAHRPAIVIDNGSRYVKAGFACDNHPLSIFRNVVGRPSYLKGKYGKYGVSYDVFVGDEAMEKIGDYQIFHPVVHGSIVHWDNMERVWHHIFYRELKAAPEDRNVILSCTSTCPLRDKFRCCEIFFEVLNSPAISVQPQSVLALYGTGAVTGIVVDIGYGKIEVAPIYQGGIISYALMDPGYSGHYISEYIKWSLANRNIDLGPMSEEYIDLLIRETLYITPNCAMSRRDFKRSYTSPTGQVVDVSQESFLAPELFFNPDLITQPRDIKMSITDAIVTATLKCDSDLRTELLGTVVLAGGLSVIPGFANRLQIELEYKTKKPVRVYSTDESYATCWLGGATYAGLKDAHKLFVTRQQFEEYGLKIIRTKFL